MTTISASNIVSVLPNVLSAGGAALDLNGLCLTNDTRVPIGTVPSFPSSAAVDEYFGGASTEAALAAKYFAGFQDSNAKPGAMLFAQYNENDVGAFIRGGDVSSLSLAELQALSGLLSITIDGVVESATINLSTATSFSSAALLIQDGLGIQGQQEAVFTGSISTTTLTVSAVASGTIGAGQVISGSGVTVGTYIVAQLSGTTGGVGTYTVSDSQTAASQSITSYDPAVAYDSVSGGYIIRSATVGDDSTISYGSGALATSLELTLVTGAVLSQGADAATPSAFMADVIAVTQNWASFFTSFDPDDADENSVKLEFAEWAGEQLDRYVYVCWDTDLSPAAAAPAASSLGALIADAELSATILIGRDNEDYDDLASVAAFVSGSLASIDFEETNGRVTLAFRRQSGLTASVSDETASENLIANGYNFYGAYGTANDEFIFFYPGSISGDFEWADSLVNEIWMTNAFQIALMTLLINSKSIPYNVAGRGLIEQSLADPINAALNFGAIRAGVTLSAAQIAAVNEDAGVRISDTLTQRGWYLQVLDATAEVRQARGSPPCKFWYTDGQSVQQIDVTSVAVL